MTTTARARFDAFWQALSADEQAKLARDYATRARADGAYVVLADGGETPIPPIITPASIDRAKMAAVSTDAHAITRGLQKLTADLMDDHTRAPLKQRLFGAFGALEQEALGATWRKSEQLATVRVDFLLDADGHARALEVNSTIPAMQGYSDAIAAAFFAAVGRARGLSDGAIAALSDSNGRNSDDLLQSLLAHHARLGGRDGAQSIAIVARAGDAQYGELMHYVRRWSARGHRVFIATPETVRILDGRAVVDGVIPDLIYRHIFARRLDPAGDFARVCLDPDRFHVFNPIPRATSRSRPCSACCRPPPSTTPSPRASASTTTSATPSPPRCRGRASMRTARRAAPTARPSPTWLPGRATTARSWS